MKLKSFTKKSILIIVSIFFLVVTVLAFCNKEKSFFFICQPEISKEGGMGTVGQKLENQAETKWQWLDNQKKLYELSSTEINSILKEIWQRFPEKEERLKALAILRLNTPYQLGCLGEESGRDKDPIFRLDTTDCTTFVLTNVALLHSRNLEDAREMMRYLNYREEDITFENRLHFTTDRNIVSSYFCDITEEIAGMDRLITTNIVLNRSNGDRLIDIDWKKEMTLKYIPNKNITKELFQILPKSIGIAFIRKRDSEIGLDVAHEGFLFDNQLFLHASLIDKKVVAINFWDYYFAKENYAPRFDGVIFFEIK